MCFVMCRDAGFVEDFLWDGEAVGRQLFISKRGIQMIARGWFDVAVGKGQNTPGSG